jgi:hypothetical protein
MGYEDQTEWAGVTLTLRWVAVATQNVAFSQHGGCQFQFLRLLERELHGIHGLQGLHKFT